MQMDEKFITLTKRESKQGDIICDVCSDLRLDFYLVLGTQKRDKEYYFICSLGRNFTPISNLKELMLEDIVQEKKLDIEYLERKIEHITQSAMEPSRNHRGICEALRVVYVLNREVKNVQEWILKNQIMRAV